MLTILKFDQVQIEKHQSMAREKNALEWDSFHSALSDSPLHNRPKLRLPGAIFWTGELINSKYASNVWQAIHD